MWYLCFLIWLDKYKQVLNHFLIIKLRLQIFAMFILDLDSASNNIIFENTDLILGATLWKKYGCVQL